jgi:hypothetical protein
LEAEDPSEKLVPIKKPLRHNTPTDYKIKFIIMAFGINNVPYLYRKWNWFGHTLRREEGAIEKTALDWNPQGYRRRGRPTRTWQSTIEDEIRNTGRSWNEVKGIAGDCNAWKLFVVALCSTRSKRT